MKALLGFGGVLLAVAAVLIFGLPDGPAIANHRAGPVQRPVLVELFTSQGCASCPPADRLIAKLDREGGAVAVSRPVTSWDELGWADTLARGANDRLQRDYATRAIPGAGAYTPEAVVGGAAAAAGGCPERTAKMNAPAMTWPSSSSSSDQRTAYGPAASPERSGITISCGLPAGT
jgi:hypothetical protein